MDIYVIEYLTTNKSGGLVDKVATIKATDADDARAKFEAKHPNVAVGFIGLDD